MTLRERIWSVHTKHPKWSPKQIAEACGCRDSYVRVVLYQRPRDGGQSEIDRRYVKKVEARVGMPFTTYRRRCKQLASATA